MTDKTQTATMSNQPNIPTFATDSDAIRYATLSNDPLTRRLAELAAESLDLPEALDAFAEALETRELPANFDDCDAADMIDTWADWDKWTLSDFLDTDWYRDLDADRRDDFINCPDRASRCYDAAEHGLDGSTHAERLQDMRDAVRHAEENGVFPPMIAQKLELEIDAVEAFHRGAGTLDDSGA